MPLIQTLSSLGPTRLHERCKELSTSSDFTVCILTLVDGQRLIGTFRYTSYSKDFDRAMTSNMPPKPLPIHTYCAAYEHCMYTVYIPIEDVASIDEANLGIDEWELDVDPDVRQHDYLDFAERNGYPCERSEVNYSLSYDADVTPTNHRPVDDVLLYADLDFFKQRSAQLSIGLSLPVGFDVKLAWSDIDRMCGKALSGTPLSLSELSRSFDEADTAVSKPLLSEGHVCFLDHGKGHHGEVHHISRHLEDGSEWIAAGISDRQITSRHNQYVFAYFRRDHILGQIDLIENCREPVRLYGEIVNISFDFDGRRFPFFFKVRAAKYFLRSAGRDQLAIEE